MATERRIGKTSDEDSNDTVRVEKLEPDEILSPPPAAPRAPGMTRGVAPRPLPSATPTPSPPPVRSYMHMPAADDMTPLPPPRVQASIIAEESSLPPPSVPLPLPPAPSTSRPQAERRPPSSPSRR